MHLCFPKHDLSFHAAPSISLTPFCAATQVRKLAYVVLRDKVAVTYLRFVI